MSKAAHEFHNLNSGATVVRKLDPIVVEKPRAPIHVHTYGGETPFFKGLTEGRLMATKCTNPKCEVAGKEGTLMLPPRVYCPDCLEKMQWEDITELARNNAKVHTYIGLERPGAFNRLPMPCNLISVEIEGVCTVLMSVLAKGAPVIGMRIEPRFKTSDPTYSILDLSWVPVA